MKKIICLLLFVLIVCELTGLFAQSFNDKSPPIPLRNGQEIMFGKDIIINAEPDQNQRQVSLCYSMNGWLFALYTYRRTSDDCPAYVVMKSTDDGNTWSLILESYEPLPNAIFNSFDLVVTGDSSSNLKIYLAYVVAFPGPTNLGNALVLRFNGETGEYEAKLLQENSAYDISIACDQLSPALNSNPFSIGILCSKFTIYGDSLIFCSSNNGGLYIDNHKCLAFTTENHYNKVSLAFGKCFSYDSGRYFAAWEEHADFTSTTGHIWTSHSEPNSTGSFTEPFMIDGVDPASVNNAKNPKIACQFNSLDNDSLNMTTVILYDKYFPASGTYNVQGLVNKTAVTSTNYQLFTLNPGADLKSQASIIFNPFDSAFLVTYYNSGIQKLPYLKKHLDFSNPDDWQIISSGYNDSGNLSEPCPKISFSTSSKTGGCVWASEGPDGTGIAMYDDPIHTLTGIPDSRSKDENFSYCVFPNPASNVCTIEFGLDNPQNITIQLFNLTGKSVHVIIDSPFPKGITHITSDISGLPAGSYIIVFKSNRLIRTSKLIIIN